MLNNLPCSPTFPSRGWERKIKPSQLDWWWAMENKRRESCGSTEKYLFFIGFWTARKLKVARFFFWIIPCRQSSKILCQRRPYLDSILLRYFDLILSRRKVNTNSWGQKTLVTEVTRHSSLIIQLSKLRHRAVEKFDPRSCVNQSWWREARCSRVIWVQLPSSRFFFLVILHLRWKEHKCSFFQGFVHNYRR